MSSGYPNGLHSTGSINYDISGVKHNFTALT